MQILKDVPAPSRLLTAAYLALATGLTLPSAKADAGANLDLTLLAPQDDGPRGEIDKLRQQLAELRQQLARLQREEAQEAKQGKAGKTAAKKPKRAKKEGGEEEREQQDDEHAVHVEVRRAEGHELPKTFTFKTSGKGAKAFVLEDGEMKELDTHDFKAADGKGSKGIWTRVLEGGDHGAGTWTMGDGDVKVFVEGGGRVVRGHAIKAGDDDDEAHAAKSGLKKVRGFAVRVGDGDDDDEAKGAKDGAKRARVIRVRGEKLDDDDGEGKAKHGLKEVRGFRIGGDDDDDDEGEDAKGRDKGMHVLRVHGGEGLKEVKLEGVKLDDVKLNDVKLDDVTVEGLKLDLPAVRKQVIERLKTRLPGGAKLDGDVKVLRVDVTDPEGKPAKVTLRSKDGAHTIDSDDDDASERKVLVLRDQGDGKARAIKIPDGGKIEVRGEAPKVNVRVKDSLDV